MRCRPTYWLWGLIPIAILSWVAVYFESEAIQSDLGLRANEALQRAGLAWAVPAFDGRDAAISGSAGDDNDGARALATIRSIWGVRIAEDHSGLIERADRFVWKAVSQGGNKLVLTGFVPSEQARKSIVTAARNRFSRYKISDEMRLARGAPDIEPWTAGTNFALTQLAELKQGAVELSALDLYIAGEAATPPAYRSVKAALKDGLPRNVALARDKVTPPTVSQYALQARYDGSALEITGLAPSEKSNAGTADRAKRFYGSARINNKLEIAAGAPKGWDEASAVALEQMSKLRSGEVDIRGEELLFKGEAADEATASAVRRQLKLDVPQNYKVVEQIRFPRSPVPDPTAGYVMGISHGGGAVEVTGMVPSEAARAALVDAVKARFPGRTVSDRTQIVAGAPDGWQQCVVAGLASLARLQNGKSILTDRNLSLTGATDDYAVSQSVPRDVKAAVGRTCEAVADVTFTGDLKANLTWKATRADNGMIRLEGQVPDDATRDEVFETAQQFFSGASVTENMTSAGAPPEPWFTAARTGLKQLSRLRRGELTIAGADVTLRGLADSSTVASEVQSAVKGDLPEGFKGNPIIEVMSANERAADQCQELMRQTTAKGTINFSRASADLTSDSAETLRELAEIANECPTFRIEIEGHTDAEGTDERNQRLSDRRARSVADFLAQSGVDSRRLSAVGYGATRPVADNESDAGRARNRRIEFVVKAN